MGEAIDYSITDHLVTNHFLVSLLITDHWSPIYAEAPAGKLITIFFLILVPINCPARTGIIAADLGKTFSFLSIQNLHNLVGVAAFFQKSGHEVKTERQTATTFIQTRSDP